MMWARSPLVIGKCTARSRTESVIGEKMLIAERRNLSVLRRAMPGSRAQPRRYRRDGQPQSPQGCWRRGSDRGRWCRIAISAQVLARSQSHRDVLQQAQGVSAQSCRADAAQPLRASPWRGRMLQLLRSCRIRFNMSGIRFSIWQPPAAFFAGLRACPKWPRPAAYALLRDVVGSVRSGICRRRRCGVRDLHPPERAHPQQCSDVAALTVIATILFCDSACSSAADINGRRSPVQCNCTRFSGTLLV
jgi:hypothetical protein